MKVLVLDGESEGKVISIPDHYSIGHTVRLPKDFKPIAFEDSTAELLAIPDRVDDYYIHDVRRRLKYNTKSLVFKVLSVQRNLFDDYLSFKMIKHNHLIYKCDYKYEEFR